MESILLVAPHPDDALYGALGYILKNYNKRFFYLVLTRGEKGYNNVYRLKQILNSLKKSGIDINLEVSSFKDTKLDSQLAQIADLIRKKVEETNAETIFTTSEGDEHQDHVAAARSSKIVGRYLDINIVEYYTPSSTFFRANSFLPITENILDLKIKILRSYQKPRRYYDPEFLRSIHRFYGTFSGVSYAEPYRIVKWILR